MREQRVVKGRARNHRDVFDSTAGAAGRALRGARSSQNFVTEHVALSTSVV